MSKKHRIRVKHLTFLLVLISQTAMALLIASHAGAFSGGGSSGGTGDWDAIAQKLDAAIKYQPVSDGFDSESGFLLNAQTLAARTDPAGNGSLSNPFIEGADLADQPVLVDVHNGINWIPGTAVRITDSWANAAQDDPTHAQAVRQVVESHRAAGLSTDIVVYGVNGNTESPVVMAYAAMAQAGYFGSPAPKVYGLKWGRAGWSTNAGTGMYALQNDLSASPAPNSAHALASNTAACGNGSESQLVQCAADQGLKALSFSAQFGPGNAAGGGTPVTPGDSTKQIVDLRSGAQVLYPGNGTGGAWASQISLESLFGSANSYERLSYLDSTKTIIFVNRTHHSAAMAALGARMLGYPASWYRWGLPGWNKNSPPAWPEKYSGVSAGFASSTREPNVTPPSISGVNAGGLSGASATISWITSLGGNAYPATSMVSWGTDPGGPYPNEVRKTVLSSAHSVILSFLPQNTPIYYTVTSFDGYGAGATSDENSFFIDTLPPVVSNVSGDNQTITASYSDADPSSGIDTSSLEVKVDGVNVEGCAAAGSPAGLVSCPTPAGLALGSHQTEVSISDNNGNAGYGAGNTAIVKPDIGTHEPASDSWSASATPNIVMNYSSPQNITTASLRIDGVPCDEAEWNQISVSCTSPVLSDGSHTVDGSVSAGSHASTDSWSFNVDTASPSVTDVAGDSSAISASFADPDPSSGIDTDSVIVKVDGITVAGCTAAGSPAGTVSCPTPEGLSVGSHPTEVTILDSAGNTGRGSGSTTIVDTAAPSITSVTGNNQTISASYSDPDPSGGIDYSSLVVRVDGVIIGGCTAAGTPAGIVSCPTPESLTVGSHPTEVTINDNAGNTGQGSGSTIVVDNAAPSVTGVTGNDNTISAAYSDRGPSSGVKTASLVVKVDGVPVNGCTATGSPSGTVRCPTPGGLAYGNHPTEVRISDNAGNTGQGSGTTTITTLGGTVPTLDQTPPTTADDSPYAWQTADFTVSLSCHDGSTLSRSGCRETRYSTDGGNTWQTGNEIDITTEGDHVIRYYSIDSAGNTEDIKTTHARLDKTLPVTINDAPQGWKTEDFTITLTCSDSGGSSCLEIWYSIDGGDFLPGSSISVNADGDHTVEYYSMDGAGNREDTRTLHARLDKRAPATVNNAPAGWQAQDFIIELACVDGISGCASTTYQLDGGAWQEGGRVAINTEGDHTLSYHSLDNAGNQEPVRTVSASLDKTGPRTMDNAPSDWQNLPFSVDLVCSDSNGLSGCTETRYSVDGAGFEQGDRVNIATDGDHTIEYYSLDGAGNQEETRTTGAKLDRTAPQTTDNAPQGWRGENFAVDLACADAGSGCASTSYRLDGGNWQDGSPVVINTEGDHTITYRSFDNAGNMEAIRTVHARLEKIAPIVSSIMPSGTIYSSSTTVSVSYSDTGSGINVDTVSVQLDGQALNGCKASEAKVDCRVSGLTSGQHTISGSLADTAGNTESFSGGFVCELPYESYYYFPWYDTVYGNTWVLTAMPKAGADNFFNIFLRDSSIEQMELVGLVGVAQGRTVPSYFANRADGPLKVAAIGGPALVSERSLFGNSFEEIWATSYGELDSHYYWPVYDSVAGEGMRNWVMVANPPENGEAVDIEVRIHVPAESGGDRVFNATLAPGQSASPEFPGLRSGPVEVKAWVEGGSPDEPGDARKVIASQRVLYDGAFNEMPGIPASNLSSYWAWTWYDNQSPGAKAWIAVGNPDAAEDVYLRITLGQSPVRTVGPLGPGEVAILNEDNPVMDGPLQISACHDPNNCENTPAAVYATQRSIWGPSFSEIAGVTEVSSNAHWTWYDMQAAGSRDWVLMANLNEEAVFAEVSIAGSQTWAGWIGKDQSQTLTFPGVIGGPVEVNAWADESRTTPREVFASQRVLWNGYFNEIIGKTN